VVAANGFGEQRNTNACRGGFSRSNAYGCAITRQSNAHSRCVDICNCRFARAYAREYARARSVTHSNISAFSDTSDAKFYANKLANRCAPPNTDPGNPPPKNADADAARSATPYGCGNAGCNRDYHGTGHTPAASTIGNSGCHLGSQAAPNQPTPARYGGATYAANHTTAFTTHTTANFAASSGNTTTAQPNDRAATHAASCAHR
jgi:hypothetical protein